jgi:hypothetical protein
VLRPDALQTKLHGFYEHGVKATVEELGLRCQRADDIFGGQTDVIEDIWIGMNEARTIIAELTDQNANVYYELGIASTLGKRVIAIHRKLSEGPAAPLPFDIRHRRTIFYEDSAAGLAAFKATLRKHIESILHSRS